MAGLVGDYAGRVNVSSEMIYCPEAARKFLLSTATSFKLLTSEAEEVD